MDSAGCQIMLLLLIFLNVFHCMISYAIHQAAAVIDNLLVISEDENIFNTAKQYDVSLVKLKNFFQSTHRNIILYWCPILIATLVLLATDLILLFKGYESAYLNYAISIMFGFGIVYITHIIKIYKYIQYFSFCVLVAYHINSAEDLNNKWKTLMLQSDTDENYNTAQQILYKQQLNIQKLAEYYDITTNEKIKNSIKDCIKSLVD